MNKEKSLMAIKSVIATSLLLILSACVPQVELVNLQTEMAAIREDTKATKARVQELQRRFNQGLQSQSAAGAGDVQGVQQSIADFGARFDQIATDLQLIQGKLEENNFRIDELDQKIDDKSVKLAELAERIDELDAQLKQPGSASRQAVAGENEKQSAPKTLEPSEAYRQSKSDFDKGNFDLALAGFQNYMAQFPDTSLASSAQYWIGECYYAKKDYSRAIESFQKVINNYPKSGKVPGAKIKIGLSYLSENNTVKAREYLHKVIDEYPETTEAAIAKDRLRKIGRK